VRTIIDLPPKNTNVLKGQTALLRCGVKHAYHIKIKVNWFHNDVPVRLHDPRIRILGDGSLRIFTIRSEETGKYTCQVKSPMGNDTRSATLKVLSNADTIFLSKGCSRKCSWAIAVVLFTYRVARKRCPCYNLNIPGDKVLNPTDVHHVSKLSKPNEMTIAIF
jgi:hypothetical protein